MGGPDLFSRLIRVFSLGGCGYLSYYILKYLLKLNYKYCILRNKNKETGIKKKVNINNV
jgi:hypothetical protein